MERNLASHFDNSYYNHELLELFMITELKVGFKQKILATAVDGNDLIPSPYPIQCQTGMRGRNNI